MRNVLVVIVNYRVGELIEACLGALAGQIPGRPGCRVVVVDNASGDGSAERLEAHIDRQGWGGWARVVRSPVNGGFAAGNNTAIRPALASERETTDYVWMLNPDTLPRPGAAEALYAFLEARPEVGLAGSRLEDADGTQHHSRYRFPTVWSELDARLGLGLVTRLLARWHIAPPLVDASHPVDWVAGASLMVRRRVFEDVGLLDEGYFLYFEELDFCLRARRAGWPCWYVVESRVAHLAGQSSGIDHKERRPRLPGYWFESRRRFWLKHHGALRAAWVDAVALAAVGFAVVRERIQGKRGLRPEGFGRDLAAHSVFARGPRLPAGQSPAAPGPGPAASGAGPAASGSDRAAS